MRTADVLRGHDKLYRRRRWCPHTPHPKQAEFLSLTCDEALYGGAAGGGKSDALLMAALQYIDVPGYAAILFRRTYADLALPDAIMARSHEWLAGSTAHWDGERHQWRFPAGSSLTFGYLDTEAHKYRYQSAAFQFVGFDELTQFLRSWYLYLFSRLRRLTGSDVPIRMRAATNPGGIGHRWVKERFVDEKTAKAPFVAAKLEDNPSLDIDEYEKALNKLDAATRSQLRDGVWVQDGSGLVYHAFHRGLVVPRPKIDPAKPWRHILSWDFGNVDDCAWGVLGWEKHCRTVYLLESDKATDMIPTECAEKTDELGERYSFDRIVGDVGGLGKGYAEEMRRRHGIPIEPAEKVNKLGYIKLMNGAMERREWLMCEGEGNEKCAVEMEELPFADENKLKEMPGLPNHLCDMNLYGWRTATAWGEEDAPPPKPQKGTPEYEEMVRLKEREESMGRAQKAREKAWKATMHGRWMR